MSMTVLFPCSAQVQDFLSAVEAKLDAVELSALELRTNAEALRGFASRQQNEVHSHEMATVYI